MNGVRLRERVAQMLTRELGLTDDELLLEFDPEMPGRLDYELRYGQGWKGRHIAAGPYVCGTPLDGWEPWPGLEPDVVAAVGPDCVVASRFVDMLLRMAPRAIVVSDVPVRKWKAALEKAGFEQAAAGVWVFRREVIGEEEEARISEALAAGLR